MFVVLATAGMLDTKPDDVAVIHNFGHIQMVVHEDESIIDGEQIVIDGDEESIKNWLSVYSPCWVGVGHPMMQEFELKEVKK